MTPDRIAPRALLAWGVCVVYVVYQFSLQMSVGVFAGELQASLATTPAVVGVLTALFALSYAVMQIPAGILLEERSLRFLMAGGLAGCALATLGFAWAPNAWVAGTCRLLMGVGASFGFVGTAVLVARWIPARHFALFIALTEALGMLGAGLADDLFALLLEHTDWRRLLAGTAGFGIAVSALLLACVRDRPGGSGATPRRATSAWADFRLLLRDRPVWVICAYYALALGAVLGFAGLWNVPFQRSFGIGLTEAATANSLIFVGMAVGCPVAGALSDRLGRRRPVVLASVAGHFLVLATILYTPLLPAPVVWALRFLLGFFAAGNVLAFAMAADRAPPHLRGAAIGAVNTFGFLGVSAAQILPGVLLGGEAAPDAAHYTAVLSTLLLGLVVGGALVWSLEEVPSGGR